MRLDVGTGEAADAKPETGRTAPEGTVAPKRPEIAERPAWHKDWLGWTFVAAGAVAVGVGGGLWAHAGGVYDDATTTTDDAGSDRLRESADEYRNVGVVLVGAGTGLAIAGIVRLILNPSPRARETAGVLVGPGSVYVSGSF